MAEKLDPRQQVATFEELILSTLYEQEATRRLLIKKGVLSQPELLEEVKAVKGELEGDGGCRGESVGVPS